MKLFSYKIDDKHSIRIQKTPLDKSAGEVELTNICECEGYTEDSLYVSHQELKDIAKFFTEAADKFPTDEVNVSAKIPEWLRENEETLKKILEDPEMTIDFAREGDDAFSTICSEGQWSKVDQYKIETELRPTGEFKDIHDEGQFGYFDSSYTDGETIIQETYAPEDERFQDWFHIEVWLTANRSKVVGWEFHDKG